MARAPIQSDRVSVRVFGATEITVGTRRIGMSTEALFALTLYLTTRAGERLPRDEVLGTFWVEGDEEARRHAMRQMLYRLRQKGMAFAEEGEFLRIDPALVESDLRRCLDTTWPETASADDVEAALSLGPTFSTRLPAPFLEWFDQVRSEVGHQARKAAMQLMVSSRARGRWNELDKWAKAVLRGDPLHEEATLARAESAAMSGAKSLALEILDSYLAEIGDEDTAIGRPAQQLRRRIAERRASWVPHGPREVALVGREAIMSALTQCVEATLTGHSHSILLLGPSGFGKSRLLAEAREYATLRGVRCIALRAEHTLASHPWSLIRELCGALVSQPGAAAVDPRSMSTIRGLLREESTADTGISFGPVTTGEQIRHSLVAMIEAISDEARILLTLDDLQNADERSLTLLQSILLDLQGGRCGCVVTSHPAAHIRPDTSGGRPSIQLLRLPPLTPSDAKALAAATAAAQGVELADEELQRIVASSGGHPLFARELAVAYARKGVSERLPSTLADIVTRNLASQPAEAMRILSIVALLGNTATIARVQDIAGLEKKDFLASVEALSQEGILQLDHARIPRLHDSWRDALLGTMPEAVIATLALECALGLQRCADPTSVAAQSRLADLYRLAGETHEAIRFRLGSIDSLLVAGLHESALKAISSEPLEGHSLTVRARFRVRESVALLATGRPEQARALADEVWRSRVLQSGTLLTEHLLAVGVSADCHIKLDAADRGPTTELLVLADNSSLSPQDTVRACLWGLRLASNDARSRELAKFAERSRTAMQGRDLTPAAALVELIFATEAGSADDIYAAYDKVRRTDQNDLSLNDRCLLLRCTAHALRICGAFDEAAANAEAAYRLAQSHGIQYAARLSAELLCNIYIDFERPNEAADWLKKLTSDSAPLYGNTRTSREHVQDRLALAQSKTSFSREQIANRLRIVHAFGNTHGRCGELAIAAAALAKLGDLESAAEVLSEVTVGVRPLLGRPVADLIIDACLAAASDTPAQALVEELAHSHLMARQTRGHLPIAPGFKLLRAIAEQSSRQRDKLSSIAMSKGT